MKRYRIINKFRFYTLVILMFAVLVASMFFIIVNATGTSSVVLVPVYVTDGDNLWNLSLQYSDDNTDIRAYIDSVMQVNELKDANIYPGEVLLFPQNIK